MAQISLNKFWKTWNLFLKACSTLKYCPMMLTGFPSLSGVDGVLEFGNYPLNPPVGRAVIPGGPWMEPSGKALLKQILSCLMTRTVKLFTGHLRCWQAAARVLHYTSSSICVCVCVIETDMTQIYRLIREKQPEIECKKRWKKLMYVWYVLVILWEVIWELWKHCLAFLQHGLTAWEND